MYTERTNKSENLARCSSACIVLVASCSIKLDAKGSIVLYNIVPYMEHKLKVSYECL